MVEEMKCKATKTADYHIKRKLMQKRLGLRNGKCDYVEVSAQETIAPC